MKGGASGCKEEEGWGQCVCACMGCRKHKGVERGGGEMEMCGEDMGVQVHVEGSKSTHSHPHPHIDPTHKCLPHHAPPLPTTSCWSR